MNQIGIFNETEEDLGVLKMDIKNVIKLAFEKGKSEKCFLQRHICWK